jgi:hypothetical protein
MRLPAPPPPENDMPEPVTLKLRGTPLGTGSRPRLLEQDDTFLPAALIAVDEAYDLSGAARASAAGSMVHALTASHGQVIVLELPDGVTVVTHPENLRQALERGDPQGIGPDGAIVLEQALRDRGAARDAAAHGLNGVLSRVYA